MSLHADAVRVLSNWQPLSDDQRELRSAYVAHLQANPDGLTKGCHPDHITASTLVVSPDRQQVLLNRHRKYAIWMQFGGHCEPGDETLAAAALREAVEESGISTLRLLGDRPVQLSTHEVLCGPVRPSHHLDVRYVAVAPTNAGATVSDESLDVRWFARDGLPDGLDRPLLELIDGSRWL